MYKLNANGEIHKRYKKRIGGGFCRWRLSGFFSKAFTNIPHLSTYNNHSWYIDNDTTVTASSLSCSVTLSYVYVDDTGLPVHKHRNALPIFITIFNHLCLENKITSGNQRVWIRTHQTISHYHLKPSSLIHH